MKRRQLHQNKHPFDSHPFEAFYSGSWKPIELLRISNGALTAHIVDDGDAIEPEIPATHLRVRSRKATASDCTSFLRPGIAVCVPVDDETNANPVWIDAKIRSVERKPHINGECDCLYYVSYYVNQGPALILENKRVSKDTSVIKINQISILQNLEKKPSDGQYYRWGSSEDCYSVPKFKGKFHADLSWLLVASALKKRTAFDIRSINSHIVYGVSENHGRDGARASCAVNFKVENEVFTPVVLQIVAENLPEGCDGPGVGSSDSGDVMELRRSKRRAVQPDRYLGCDNLPDYDIEVTRVCENKTYVKVEYDEVKLEYNDDDDEDGGDVQTCARPLKRKLNEDFPSCGGKSSMHKYNTNKGSHVSKHDGKSSMRKHVPKHASVEEFLNLRDPKDEPKDIDDMIFVDSGDEPPSLRKSKLHGLNSVEGGNRSGGAKWGLPRKYHKRGGQSGSLRSNCYYVQEGGSDGRNYSMGSANAQLCRDLIRRCMTNIEETLKNEPERLHIVEHWEEFQSSRSFNKGKDDDEEKPSISNEEEMSEIDMLWNEMELALASWYLLDDNEDPHIQPPVEAHESKKNGENICEHDCRLDEQVGMVCELCGFVETEIKDILPPFVISSAHWSSNKEQRTKEDPDHRPDEDQVPLPVPSNPSSINAEPESNVWALIPDLENILKPHQKKAFEFLWRNIAGSLVPSQMEEMKDERGGCVISHSPGAGKTLLIIAFLVSYLKLFPASRPLVLAPKTTLYTWYKEIIKWEVPIPVYQIHGNQTFRCQAKKSAPGLPRNQDVMHVIDCLEKMQKWISSPSILLMGYTSFMTLTREDAKYTHRKFMAQLLKECPGILILDEGHNPRSTKSRLRKGLMKVNTRLRVLLSGTLFQNNFGEYFNTLCLARPVFVNEVMEELDPKYGKRNEEGRTQFSLENRGRKLLIDKIAKKVDSSRGEERGQALETLKKLTSTFIDKYEGANSEKLPGLECYTLMMKSTTIQQEILLKIQSKREDYKGLPLALELLITLGAIHPCLIKTAPCSVHYFTSKELKDLVKLKFDIMSSSKVRFVMNLIPRCLVREEKVLIFCRHIAPINLFLQIFEKFYGWHNGKEVLVLKGDIELFQRGRIIDKFEEMQGPSKVMLASISACAEGISLTAASRVILLDSEWNPSKSKQAIARAFRPGQSKVVYVYQLFASGTLEEEKHSRTTWKEWVSDMIFSDERVEDPSRWQGQKIEDELLREIVEDDRGVMFNSIVKNEKAFNVIRGKAVHAQENVR